jgi:DNA polymerase-3 subunit beta
LSKVEHKTEESGFYNFSMVVPNKGIIEIKRLLEEGQGPVSIGSLEGSVFVRREVEVEKGAEDTSPQTAEFVLVSKLIEAEFPPYDQVIPKSKERSVVVPRGALLEALRRVSVVSSERTLGVKFQLSEGALQISTDNPSVGEGSEVIDIGYEGEELEIGFNARYFIDVLSVLDDDDVTLELSGSLDPAVIKDESGGYIGVIMPMRI